VRGDSWLGRESSEQSQFVRSDNSPHTFVNVFGVGARSFQTADLMVYGAGLAMIDLTAVGAGSWHQSPEAASLRYRTILTIAKEPHFPLPPQTRCSYHLPSIPPSTFQPRSTQRIVTSSIKVTINERHRHHADQHPSIARSLCPAFPNPKPLSLPSPLALSAPRGARPGLPGLPCRIAI
jgi:hypothetical protein